MTKRYLHISFHFFSTPLAKELEPVMTLLGEDWVRYAHNCWIIWTPNEPMFIHQRLLQHIKPEDHALILELKNGVALGRMPKWIWDWINKPRQ